MLKHSLFLFSLITSFCARAQDLDQAMRELSKSRDGAQQVNAKAFDALNKGGEAEKMSQALQLVRDPSALKPAALDAEVQRQNDSILKEVSAGK